MTEKNIKKMQNLQKMIADIDQKIQLLKSQKEIYEISLKKLKDKTSE